MKIKHAVIPCAGFGTRFLPITKAVPKELLAIADKPTLHYIVEEAALSGIEEVLIIISPQKEEIKHYFTPNKPLNAQLEACGKLKELGLANIDYGVNISFAVQEKMTGNGKAVELAKDFVKGQPFAVLFGDDVVYTGDGAPVTKQLIDAYEREGRTIVGCQHAPEDVARKCGCMRITAERGNTYDIDGIVEKPQGDIPSDVVSLGRFVLSPEVFDEIERAVPTKGGEVYLTSALDALAKRGRAAAYCFDGRRYDIGSKQGYLEAVVEYSLRDKELKDDFKTYLKSIAENLE